jgi:membrane protease YdiL (CAAX protease family)
MSLFERACVNKKLFLILLLTCILANIAVLPYASSLGLLRVAELPIPLPIAILVQIIQASIFSVITIFVGLFLGKKVGLGAPILEDWLQPESTGKNFRPILKISIVSGVLVAISLFILDRFAFGYFIEPVTAFQEKAPLWQRILVSFYGGIGEEIFMRLFLVTLIIWVIQKLMRIRESKSIAPAAWVSIIVVSVVFGLGHLPMTATFTTITPLVIIRGIVLNGIAGIVFGWLYWKKGLEAAIISHFSADIVLHVILPSLY